MRQRNVMLCGKRLFILETENEMFFPALRSKFYNSH